MTNSPFDSDAITLPAIAVTREARNPYLVGFAIIGGLSWFMAFILWLTRAQVVDYTIYNIDDATALAWWINALVFTGIATALASAVVAGMRHELRLVSRR